LPQADPGFRRPLITMDYLRSKRSSTHQPLEDQRPAKRISTPAGQRLSLVIESTKAKRSQSPAAAKISVTTTSTYCNDPSHLHVEPVQHAHRTKRISGVVSALTGGRLNTPRESSEDRTPNGSALSVSVWSDQDAEKFGHIRQRRYGGNWSRKKIALLIAVVLAVIIALALGVALGVKKKPASRYDSIYSIQHSTLTPDPVVRLPPPPATLIPQPLRPLQARFLRPTSPPPQLHRSPPPPFHPAFLPAATLS
jgi:hypothetical protein